MCAQWRVRFYFRSFFVSRRLERRGPRKAAQRLWYLQWLQGGVRAAACLLRRLRRASGPLTAQISVRDRLGVTRAQAHMLTSEFAPGTTSTRVRPREQTLKVRDVIAEHSDWHGAVFEIEASRHQSAADSPGAKEWKLTFTLNLWSWGTRLQVQAVPPPPALWGHQGGRVTRLIMLHTSSFSVFPAEACFISPKRIFYWGSGVSLYWVSYLCFHGPRLWFPDLILDPEEATECA